MARPTRQSSRTRVTRPIALSIAVYGHATVSKKGFDLRPAAAVECASSPTTRRSSGWCAKRTRHFPWKCLRICDAKSWALRVATNERWPVDRVAKHGPCCLAGLSLNRVPGSRTSMHPSRKRSWKPCDESFARAAPLAIPLGDKPSPHASVYKPRSVLATVLGSM